MAKHNTSEKKWYYIIGGIVLLAIIIAAFWIPQTAFVFNRVDGLNSDFTALLGLKLSANDIESNCRQVPNTDGQMVCLINSIMHNVYGYVIFDGPAKVSKSTRDSFIRSMTRLNTEVKKPDEYSQFSRTQKKTWDKTFGKGIFSTTLLSTVKKNSYSFADVQKIATELDKSLNVWCTGLSTVFVSGQFDQFYDVQRDESEMDMWLQICAKKPPRVFSATKDSILFDMPNIDLYQYNRYRTECETPRYIEPTCQAAGCPTSTTCALIPLETTEKKFIGTLTFSELNIQIRKLGNDYIFAVNEGIADSSKFTRELDFSKYILQMPYREGMDVRDLFDKVGFVVVTTNDKIMKLIDDVKDMRQN